MIERMIMRKKPEILLQENHSGHHVDNRHETFDNKLHSSNKKLKYNQPQRAISITIVAIIAITSSIVIVVNVSTHSSRAFTSALCVRSSSKQDKWPPIAAL